MSEFYKQGDCTICEQWFPLLHWHHTIPQACGGVNSKQIPLCAQCHNNLHAAGSNIVARMNSGGKIALKNYWRNRREEHNASQWVEILVKAIIEEQSRTDKKYVMQFKAPSALHTALQLYKMDSKVGSLEKAILLALSEFLRHRGYLDNERQQHSKGNQQQNPNRTPRSIADVW